MSKKSIYQYSTINALMNGYYTGGVTVKEIKNIGNLGLGTFDALDGEMVVIDGNVYRARFDGKIELAKNAETSPFVNVVQFEEDTSFMLTAVDSFRELENVLSNHIGKSNTIYAFKITGKFNFVKVRSVQRQHIPYPTLKDAASNQAEFAAVNKAGTIVGFYFPEYMKDINVHGFHFHFLADDKTIGGHLLNISSDSAIVSVGKYPVFNLELPIDSEFNHLNLKIDEDELHAIERDTTTR